MTFGYSLSAQDWTRTQADLSLRFTMYFLRVCLKYMINAMTDFSTVKIPFLDSDVPCRQLIISARVCSPVDDVNASNTCLTAKPLKHGYRYHKLRRHNEFIQNSMSIKMSFTSRPKILC